MNAMLEMARKENAAVKRSWLGEVREEMDIILSDVPRYSKEPLAELVQETSDVSGVPVEEIMGRSRKQPIARVRQYVIWKARQRDYTLEALGHFFGRDHTSIRHAILATEKRLSAVEYKK